MVGTTGLFPVGNIAPVPLSKWRTRAPVSQSLSLISKSSSAVPNARFSLVGPVKSPAREATPSTTPLREKELPRCFLLRRPTDLQLSYTFVKRPLRSGFGQIWSGHSGRIDRRRLNCGNGVRRSSDGCRTFLRRSGLGTPRRRRALQGTETFGKFAVLRLQLPEHAPENCDVL